MRVRRPDNKMGALNVSDSFWVRSHEIPCLRMGSFRPQMDVYIFNK